MQSTPQSTVLPKDEVTGWVDDLNKPDYHKKKKLPKERVRKPKLKQLS